MSEVHIFAILHCKPDKVDRVKELMSNLAKSVHEKEDYTIRYMPTERIDADGETDICIFETYKDQDSAKKHTTEEHFKNLFSTFQQEGLGSKLPYIATTKSFAGFDSDRKLMN